MGYCTPKQHAEFIRQAPLFEQMLVNDGISLTKLWFSVSSSEQRTRFTIRQVDPVRQWKLSPTDLASLDKWDDYTAAKEDMFAWTDTDVAPWTVVKSNDKKRARINAMRHVLVSSTTTTRTMRWSASPTPSSWDAHSLRLTPRVWAAVGGRRAICRGAVVLARHDAAAGGSRSRRPGRSRIWSTKTATRRWRRRRPADPRLQSAMASELTTQLARCLRQRL